MFNGLTCMTGASLAAPVRTRILPAALVAASFFAVAAPAAAPSFSPAAGVATLTYTFRLTATGIDRPESRERDVTWTINDQYETRVTMIAQPPMSMAGLHLQGANGERPKPAAASDDPAANRARAQKAVQECSDEPGCMRRESGGGRPPPDSAKAAGWSGPRYQGFSGDTQSGTYRIDEKAHEAYYDAVCSSSNETPCACDTAVSGEGAVRDNQGNTRRKTPLMAELDMAEGTLAFYVAYPGPAHVRRTVTSASKHFKAGTFDARRSLHGVGRDNQPVRALCGECKTAAGQIVMDLKDELKGHTAKLVIDWKFERP